MCDGNVAFNCVTDLAAGIRTLEEQSCDETGQTCVLLEDGAYCGIVPEPSCEDDDAAAAAPIEMSVEEAIKSAYFYQR